MSWDARKKRNVKKLVTKGLFEYIKNTNPNRVFKCYLCLPSTRAADVKEALRQGVIDKNTKIIAIENNYDHLRSMKANLTKLGFKAKSRFVIWDDLCNITSNHLMLICKSLGVDGVDLFYIDTCNCLIKCLQNWIKDVVGSVRTTDAIIATNILAARATWDLHKYLDRENYPFDESNINKWSSPIAHCLQDITMEITGFIVGYKEESVSTPMMLCVNGYGSECSNTTIAKSIVNSHTYQNLGYA